VIVLVKCEGSVRSCGPWRLALTWALLCALAWIVWWRGRGIAALLVLGSIGGRLPIHVPGVPPWTRPLGIIALSSGMILALVALFSSAAKAHTEPGSHTFFAAGWFRGVLIVAALGTLLILSVPYLLTWLTP
jgi:hypothetical protein